MSWTLSLNNVNNEELREKSKELFNASYPEAIEGVKREFGQAVYSAEEMMYDGFGMTVGDRSRFNVQMSGHVSDGDAESFISVIVTLRKEEMMSGIEMKEAQAKEPANV